jgi:hypothetical protein
MPISADLYFFILGSQSPLGHIKWAYYIIRNLLFLDPKSLRYFTVIRHSDHFSAFLFSTSYGV